MPIVRMLSLKDVRPEARASVEAWALKADPPRKRVFYKFFSDGPEGASRGSIGGSAGGGGKPQTTMEEAEKELEGRNWHTQYQLVNNSLGPALEQMKKRAQSGSERILLPLIREVMKPHIEKEMKSFEEKFTEAELQEFIRLMRSLSIAFEQDRSAFDSVYSMSFIPKKMENVPAPPVDYRASALSAPITFAPPKTRVERPVAKPKSKARPEMYKQAARPQAQKGLLSWAGQEKHMANSSYRTFFQKPPENLPTIKLSQQLVSNACGRTGPILGLEVEGLGGSVFQNAPENLPTGKLSQQLVSNACERTVPDHLVTDELRHNPVFLPWEMESRHRLRQSKLSACPSWHLLYKEGVVFGADGGAPANKGEKTIYMRDFDAEASVMTQSKPTLDPFGSSITIGMSDYPYHTTTYQATIARSATMEYDRRLV